MFVELILEEGTGKQNRYVLEGRGQIVVENQSILISLRAEQLRAHGTILYARSDTTMVDRSTR